ncbi:MAG: hypothetical protein ACOX0Q_06965 [Syntrophomonadaceae bacterium]
MHVGDDPAEGAAKPAAFCAALRAWAWTPWSPASRSTAIR